MCVAPPLFLFAVVVAPSFQSLMSLAAIVSAVSAVKPSAASTNVPSRITCPAVDCLSQPI
jgi:hypothetical protein